MSEDPTIIGIAFGNTNSSIAYPTKEGKVEVIANEDGHRSIPSALSYAGGDEFHGFDAKHQLIRNGANTVANFRDFIGKDFDEIDPTNSAGSAHPVDIDGKVGYKISANTSHPVMSVGDVAVRHLARLKDSASGFLGKEIDGVVLTAPTDFDSDQREELSKLANEAGLNVLQVINEPTAAVLAYSPIDETSDAQPEDKIIVVLDFGGTRSDGAVIASRGGQYTILATHHDYVLGGYLLDRALIDFFSKEFEKKFKLDPRSEPRSLAKLQAETEKTKKTLSQSTSAPLSVESLAGGHDFHTTINRLRFELLSRSVFDKFIAFSQALIKKAKLDPLDVDEVILAGGTSNVPKISSRISDVFSGQGTKIWSPSLDTKALNPSELISRGAALQASLISGFDSQEIGESLQPVVTTASHLEAPIGVLEGEDKFVPILNAETALPIKKSITLVGPAETGDVLIPIYEGKSEIKVTKKEPDAKQDDDEGDESDFSSDEEDEEIRERVLKPTSKLAELVVKEVSKPNAKIEVIINISKNLKATITAREIGGNGIPATGTISFTS